MFSNIIDFFVRDIPYAIKNFKVWFKTIWSDRNWDHYYIYVILRHKLHLTEQHIRKYHRHTTALRDSHKIKICVLLLDRLIKDEYNLNAFKRHDEKWGEAKFDFKNRECIVSHPNVKTPEDSEKERKDFKDSIKIEEMLKDQDLDLLFKLLRKHIQSWWD